MEVKYLNEVKRIFGYYETINDELISEALATNFDYENLVDRFNDELELNLATSGSNSENVIRLYLKRLYSVFFIINTDLILNKTEQKDHFDKYVFCCTNNLINIFYSLEENCLQFNIDLRSIINQMGMNEIFDYVLTINGPPLYEIEENSITVENRRADVKVCILHDIGLIDFLISKGYSHNNIATLIEYLTNERVKKSSVNTTLSRISDTDILDKNKELIESIKVTLKLVK